MVRLCLEALTNGILEEQHITEAVMKIPDAVDDDDTIADEVEVKVCTDSVADSETIIDDIISVVRDEENSIKDDVIKDEIKDVVYDSELAGKDGDKLEVIVDAVLDAESILEDKTEEIKDGEIDAEDEGIVDEDETAIVDLSIAGVWLNVDWVKTEVASTTKEDELSTPTVDEGKSEEEAVGVISALELAEDNNVVWSIITENTAPVVNDADDGVGLTEITTVIEGRTVELSPNSEAELVSISDTEELVRTADDVNWVAGTNELETDKTVPNVDDVRLSETNELFSNSNEDAVDNTVENISDGTVGPAENDVRVAGDDDELGSEERIDELSIAVEDETSLTSEDDNVNEVPGVVKIAKDDVGITVCRSDEGLIKVSRTDDEEITADGSTDDATFADVFSENVDICDTVGTTDVMELYGWDVKGSTIDENVLFVSNTDAKGVDGESDMRSVTGVVCATIVEDISDDITALDTNKEKTVDVPVTGKDIDEDNFTGSEEDRESSIEVDDFNTSDEDPLCRDDVGVENSAELGVLEKLDDKENSKGVDEGAKEKDELEGVSNEVDSITTL